MRQAFLTAVTQLTAQFGGGGGPAGWRLDKLRAAPVVSSAQVPIIGYGHRAAAASPWLVAESSAGSAALLAPPGVGGPDWRMIVQLSRGPGGVTAEGIYRGGQSDNPASTWYANLTARWKAGGFLLLPPAGTSVIGRAAMGVPAMSKVVSRSEVDRLGKRGSYRLGGLGPPGPGRPGPPRPFQLSFLGPQHRGSAVAWILFALLSIAVIAGGALLGLWFLPFVVGLATGVVMRWGWWRLRVTVPAVLVMACAGWGLALWIMAARGQAVGPTARTIASLAGFPDIAALAIASTLGVSALQGLAGLWLGRAAAPRPARD